MQSIELIRFKPVSYTHLDVYKRQPLRDSLYKHVNDIHDIAPHLLTGIENFFMTYKKLETKVVVTDGWADLKKP